MNINEAMKYIHLESWRGSKLGLKRMKEIMDKLGNPQDSLKFIHVTGTNGKGSVCAMLSEILMCSGYKTGRYISPYIEVFNERMSINDVYITDDELIELVEEIQPHIESMEEKPTEFELITAISFLYFKKNNCDIVVLEVGLGGRLDSTNVIKSSVVSVITGIGLDHTNILGNTIEEIALEKAGIIKEYSAVVIGSLDKTSQKVFEFKTQETNSQLRRVDPTKLIVGRKSLDFQQFSYKDRIDLKINLLGNYQGNNLMVVLEVVDILKEKDYRVSEKSIRTALEKVSWPGRFEVLSRKPICIVDGAHNPQAVRSFIETIKTYFSSQKVTFIMGVMHDKDYIEMVELMIPYAKRFILVTPNIDRALPSSILKDEIEKVFEGEVIDATTVNQGVKNIFDCDKNEIFCILGSLYMIGDIKRAFKEFK